MKRITAFLTALLLAVSCAFSACAQETKSITFRGVPWGTAHDEAIKQLQTDGVSFDTYAMGSQMKTVKDIIYDGIGFYNYDVSFYHRIGYQSPKFSVAGYSDAGMGCCMGCICAGCWPMRSCSSWPGIGCPGAK